jgi:signal peptidase I
LPGDVIDVREGSVWVNGIRQKEDFTLGRTDVGDPYQYRGEFEQKTKVFPYKVPPRCYFAMGDNRQNSLDSRFWGCVPRQNIIGTPVMIYMSIQAPESAWQPGNLGARFTAYVNGILHPSTVRWRRLFHFF